MSDDSVYSIKDRSNEVVLSETLDDARSTSQYQIKPSQKEGFQEHAIKEIILSVLAEELDGECIPIISARILQDCHYYTGKQYQGGLIEEWTSKISDIVSMKVKELNMSRYKHIVQVVIVQQTGAGCR